MNGWFVRRRKTSWPKASPACAAGGRDPLPLRVVRARRVSDPAALTVAEPRPAATVVLVRPGADGLEVLLAHRPATMAFAPGVHVFPGGSVDAGDADPRLLARSAITPEMAAVRLGGDLA